MPINALGELLRSWRESRRISLRQFAMNIGLDPSNYSKIERGVGPRPTQEVLERIARGFGVTAGSDPEWFEMVNAVSADRGAFPEDLLMKREIAESLPAFFRSLRERGATSHEDMYDLFVRTLEGDR